MKVIVLCGGYATRLWPITMGRAKCLLPFGRKKIIDLILEEVNKLFSPDKIIISTNLRFQRDLSGHISERYGSCCIFVEESTKEEEKLGTIGGLDMLIGELEIKDDVLIIAGDNISSLDFGDFLAFYRGKRKATIALFDVGRRELARNYGVVTIDKEGKIVSFEEKPEQPTSTLISTGYYVLTRRDLKLLGEYVEMGMKRDAPGYFLEWLTERTDVYGFPFSGYWYDIGTLDTYLGALKTLKGIDIDERARVDENVELVGPVTVMAAAVLEGRSRVGPNVLLMEGVRVKDSKIINSVLFRGAEVVGSRIESSLLDEECRVINSVLTSSLLGPHSKVYGEGKILSPW